ncbi:chemotaxis protein CheA [Vibrio sp. 10N.261.55.A7]|uniref:chemotaxis protein CheA n=1 Tax=Vibrio sp. 10N.261.55.A7 TaxID=1880851 RepID=UPI000C838DD5|nr:chemotaxis protein CheA [Vibrio sp. 10N.261.55.A7]PMK01194.1 chemotaxis protein CheA [Vibrio sp. 10N.261.55.A7]
MALDMDQLRKMFYEECRENLEVLENELLNIDLANVEKETINTIFRAAHSIKGGAATFNLFDISEFTHSIEAFLDLVRNDEKDLTKNSIDVLLKGGDCIQSMLAGHESDEIVDEELKASVNALIEGLLSDSGSDESIEPTSEHVDVDESEHDSEPSKVQETTVEGSPKHWSIEFKPHREMFFSGNDPLRIIRELMEFDENGSVEANLDNIPEIAEIEEELCYLSWKISVSGDVSLADIEEVFEWVEDECDLTIEPVYEGEGVSDVSPANEDKEANIQETSQEPSLSKSSPSNLSPSIPEAQNGGTSNRSQTNASSTDSAPSASISENSVPATNASASTKAVKGDSSVSSIRVDIDKVDGLINLVGELVITQSMLNEIGNDFSIDKLDKLKEGLDQLLQNSRDLQENVLNIRMLPMSFAFSRFPRLVRDLCGRLEKQVDLQITGENTELDKTVLERIVDPLVHLVRNGIDHGIEIPEVRRESGKSEEGVISLNAYHQGGAIIIEIKDDGAGIDCDVLWRKAIEKGVLAEDSRREEMTDKQVLNLIFAPGFSTADEVSDISGRGVGMDVVKRNIEELGGHIEVDSKLGIGSHFTISLPLTLAILDGQLVKVGSEVYVIPLLTIIESIQISPECIKHASGGVELYRLRDENIPILRLQDELEMGESGPLNDRILCLVEAAGTRVGLVLDELLDQQQVVIKSLESNYSKVPGISGATILGNGAVSLILDIQGLITSYLTKSSGSSNKGIAA